MEAGLLTDGLEDLRHGLALKDPTVSRARQEPEPRAYDSPVLVQPIAKSRLRELGDDAVKVTRRLTLFDGESERERLAENLVGIELPLLAHQRQVEVEGLAHLLRCGEPLQQ